MPLDDSFGNNYYWIEHQSFYLNLCTWKITRTIFPKRDALTNKWLWLKPVMKGTRVITGPGTPVVEYYWLDKDEYFIWKLKGNT